MSKTEAFLNFRVGGKVECLPAACVREVVRRPKLTRIPQAPAALTGLANIRGEATPVVSLCALLGRPQSESGRLLILERSPPLALLVDEVAQVEERKGGQSSIDLESLLDAAMPKAVPRTSIMRRITPDEAQAMQGDEAELRLVCFTIGGQEFALPIEQVDEVTRVPVSRTPLPHADAAVAGTTMHRGMLLPLFHLDRLLALSGASRPEMQRVIVTRIAGRRTGLLVDAVHSIVAIPENAVDPVPAVIARRSSEARVQAIARIGDDRLVSVLARDHLLDMAVLGQIEDRDQEEAEMADDEREAFLLFTIGGQSFGLPAASVAEVVRLPERLQRVPRAPDFVSGIMNLRGRAVPVIDQRLRFGTTVDAGAARQRALVMTIGSLQAAFVVDEIREVRSVPVSAIAASPGISTDTEIFDRVATLDGDERILLLIEPTALLDQAERDMLTALNPQAGATPQ